MHSCCLWWFKGTQRKYCCFAITLVVTKLQRICKQKLQVKSLKAVRNMSSLTHQNMSLLTIFVYSKCKTTSVRMPNGNCLSSGCLINDFTTQSVRSPRIVFCSGILAYFKEKLWIRNAWGISNLIFFYM